MSESVKNMFTEISPTYDRLNHFLSFNFDKSWRRKTIASIQQEQSQEFSVLDICCGTHDMGLECLRQFPNSKITGIDFSQGMLDAGVEKIKKELDSGKIKTVCGDALALPFEDNSFDVLFCAYGVRNFDNTQKGMQEMMRVLKPGGQVLVLEFFKPTSIINRAFNKTYGQYLLPLFGKWISGHSSAYHYLRDSIRGFKTVPEFQSLISNLGFINVKTKSFFMNISHCVSAFKPKN